MIPPMEKGFPWETGFSVFGRGCRGSGMKFMILSGSGVGIGVGEGEGDGRGRYSTDCVYSGASEDVEAFFLQPILQRQTKTTNALARNKQQLICGAFFMGMLRRNKNNIRILPECHEHEMNRFGQNSILFKGINEEDGKAWTVENERKFS